MPGGCAIHVFSQRNIYIYIYIYIYICMYTYIYIYIYIYVCIHIYIYIYIYYYTPLPLNVANKQQATSNNKHFSFPFWPLLGLIALGSTPPWPPWSLGGGLAKSKFRAKNSPLAPRSGGAKSGGALPKLRILCPKTAFFGQKWPQNPVITAKRRQTIQALHVRHDCLMNKSPFFPSSSTICPRKSPKMAKTPRKYALFESNTAKTKNGLYLRLRGSKPSSKGTYSTRNPQPFVVSKPHNRPTRCLDPRTSGHLVDIYIYIYIYPLIYTPLPNSR